MKHQPKFVFHCFKSLKLLIGLLSFLISTTPSKAEFCLNRLPAVSKMYGNDESYFLGIQEGTTKKIPHIPDFLTIDPGSTINFQRQTPGSSCGGCAVLFSASINNYNLGNSHIPALKSKKSVECLLIKNVSLTISDGIQTHTFEVFSFDPVTDELLAVDFAPEISMLQNGKNFAGISGKPMTLPNNIIVFSLKISDIYQHLTSIHFLVDPNQLSNLSDVLTLSMTRAEIASHLVLASAISRNTDGLRRSLNVLKRYDTETKTGKLGSIVLYLLDFQDGSVKKETLDFIRFYFPESHYDSEREMMMFSLNTIINDVFIPYSNSDFPDLIIDLISKDLSSDAVANLLNGMYSKFEGAPMRIQKSLAESLYKTNQSERAIPLLISIEGQTRKRIGQLIRPPSNDSALNIFHSYMYLDGPLNLELISLRKIRRETLMMLFSIYYDELGINAVKVGELAKVLVLEYPDFPEHWLNYATIVSSRGENACAHALIESGVLYSREGFDAIGKYLDEFKKSNDKIRNQEDNIINIVKSHPVLSRALICFQLKLTPRCFDESRVLEQHVAKPVADTCLRFDG